MIAVPQVLLLGNGVNQGFEGVSWEEMLQNNTTNPRIQPQEKLALPMPLQIILRTEDHVDRMMKKEQQSLLRSSLQKEQAAILRRILDCGFDHILTTNYTYELEAASRSDLTAPVSWLTGCAKNAEGKRIEPKYLLHTYQSVNWNGKENRIWHIHGEARKPDSLVIGHYYYGKLFSKLSSEVEKAGNRYKWAQDRGVMPSVRSWADAFLLGDVYTLGFGFDFSEFDLWWLLNRKKRENAAVGKVCFFAPAEPGGAQWEKTELLRTMGAEIETCGFTITKDMSREEKNAAYLAFYNEAMNRIGERLKGLVPVK